MDRKRRTVWLLALSCGALCLLAGAADPPADKAAAPPVALRFDVPLPITGLVDQQVQSQVERALRKLPKDGPRSIFIFEFRPKSATAGEGSDFGRALSLARFLSGDRLAQVRTVAWLPRSVKGHAVLPVLACEQIVMQKEAELGAAGADETSIDATLRRGYSEIAGRRRTVPPAIALGLLDKDLGVFKVTTQDGVRYELADDLTKLREAGAVTKEETIFQPGDPHVLSGSQMRFSFGFASHLANDKRGLAVALELPAATLQQQLTPDEGWQPMRLEVTGPIHAQLVNFLLRELQDHHSRGDFNLLFLHIRSAGGDLTQSLRLAQGVAGLGPKVHTVAYVDVEARSDAALIALACDELVVGPEAILGGPGERSLTGDELAALREPLAELSRQNDRDWSLPLALVDRGVQVFRYTRASAATCVTCRQASWNCSTIKTSGNAPASRSIRPKGSAAKRPRKSAWPAAVVANFDEVKNLYQIDGDIAPVRPNWGLAVVEWLADPRIAGVLLFVAWFALMFEMSTPGVGLPGFISAVCFLLYFWSQFLHGTAGWLEILLFAGGIVCLGIELFILPGFGAFGAGGAIMVIASIVLASQTFVIPTNSYQLRQFPISLLMVAAGMAGGIAAIAAIRRFLPDTPYFNRMILKPPAAEEREDLARREALVMWEHLLNKRGVTTTPLVPAGKALFGDELVDVISAGELLEKGAAVVVAEVAGNRVLVKRAANT